MNMVTEVLPGCYHDARKFSAEGVWLSGSLQEVFTNREGVATLISVTDAPRVGDNFVQNQVTAEIKIGGLKKGDFVVLREKRRVFHTCVLKTAEERQRFQLHRGKQELWMVSGLLWGRWARSPEVQNAARAFLAKRVGKPIVSRQFEDFTEEYAHWLMIANNLLRPEEVQQLVCSTYCRNFSEASVATMPLRIARYYREFWPPAAPPPRYWPPANLVKLELPK